MSDLFTGNISGLYLRGCRYKCLDNELFESDHTDDSPAVTCPTLQVKISPYIPLKESFDGIVLITDDVSSATVAEPTLGNRKIFEVNR